MFHKTRSRNRNQGIKEKVLMPVRINDCEEGAASNGNSFLKLTLQHLLSKEVFKSNVFENSLPLYVSEQILDAVLPENMLDYNLQDLVGKGLMVEVAFNTTSNTTFINIIKAVPLNSKYKPYLQQLEQKEEQEKQSLQQALHDMENEMDDQEEDDDLDLDLDEDNEPYTEQDSEDDIDSQLDGIVW